MISELASRHIGVLCGGFSAERAVSLRSGKNIHAALTRLGYRATLIDPATDDLLGHQIDVAFNVLHGFFGEDGGVQSLLDLYQIPYTGSGPAASMLSMNKILTKQLLVKEGFPTAPYVVATQDNCATIAIPFALPWIIKPVTLGSSVGIAICDSRADFDVQVALLTQQHGACLVEACISGQEITIGILDDGETAEVLPILELSPKNKFYDYDAKYTPQQTDFILPANLSPDMTATCQGLALNLHRKMGCHGMSRTDMIVSPTLGPIILELNSVPGMTDTSDLPAQAKAAGLSFDALVERILASAL